MTKYIRIPIAFALLISVSASNCAESQGQGQSSNVVTPALVSSTDKWTEYENNPVIRYDDAVKGILFNDPTVIKDGSQYRMYLGGGKPFDQPLIVNTYEARSDDGINWTVNPKPVLETGPRGSWDEASVETPSVIKVGSTYHMYYSGCTIPCNVGKYNIGHATSSDGTNWVKDPRNPILTHHDDYTRWGFYTAAEPGAVYHDGTFYLYYASARSNYPEYGSPFGILLATSRDGTNFEEQGAVYTLTSSYDASKYRGYSTPMVYVDDKGVFHLYHDVVYSPDNPDGFEQVAISHATSTDGRSFTEADINIVKLEADWKRVSIIGPTALQDGNVTKLWFAAQTDSPARDWSGFGFGIGYATKQED
jgi:predicted GH43/DUF377 family glycosyl hydrolase